MNLGPVSEFYKSNKTKSKKFDDDVMSENCDFIFICWIFNQFGAIRKQDSGPIVKFMFSLRITIYLTKTENRTKKSLTQLTHHYFE